MVLDKIREFVVEQLSVDPELVDIDSNLMDDLKADSLYDYSRKSSERT